MASVQPIELPSRTRVSHRPTTQIQELVAVSYGLHPRCMTARWRGYRHVSWVRQIAMYLTRQITHRSMPAIGEAFGGRDHTTVLHAIRKVEQRMRDDPIIAADVDTLRKALTKNPLDVGHGSGIQSR
jgi:chromosomal replication initiator protein